MTKSLKIILPALLAIAAIILVIHFKYPGLLGSKTSVTKFTDTGNGSLQSYLDQAQNLNPSGTMASTTAAFLAVGDIMLSRNVAAAIQKSGDVDLPFRNISDILKSTDFNFANMESPIASSTANQIVGGHSLIFGAPAGYIKGLTDYNFKILNLANNHSSDLGFLGINDTKNILDNLGIKHEGTGDNLDEAWKPAIVNTNGITICFIGASFASVNDGGKTTNNYVARIEDTTHLQSAIATAKSECDFVVVTMHAGVEYTRMPNSAQIKFARAAIDDGADIVIGAHPHWMQTIEKYQGKYIFYSLGNFIFDQAWSRDTQEGLTLKITIGKTGCSASPPLGEMSASGGQRGCSDNLQGSRQPATLQSIELIPVIISNSQPRPATSAETKNILNKIGETQTILTP
jgi:poly-gamma-glutamate synthesis protein (capsule biosynthesis protein)